MKKSNRAIYIGCGLDTRPLFLKLDQRIKYFYYIDIYPQIFIKNVLTKPDSHTYMNLINKLDAIFLSCGFNLINCSHYIRTYRERKYFRSRYVIYFTNIKFPSDFSKIQSYVLYFNIIICARFKPSICFYTNIYTKNLERMLNNKKFRKISLVIFENNQYFIDTNDKSSLIYHLHYNAAMRAQFKYFYHVSYANSTPAVSRFDNWKQLIDYHVKNSDFFENLKMNDFLIEGKMDEKGCSSFYLDQKANNCTDGNLDCAATLIMESSEYSHSSHSGSTTPLTHLDRNHSGVLFVWEASDVPEPDSWYTIK